MIVDDKTIKNGHWRKLTQNPKTEECPIKNKWGDNPNLKDRLCD